MLLNVKAVKGMAKSYGKQVSREYIEQLEFIVRERINKSIRNGRNFKRLKASELI